VLDLSTGRLPSLGVRVGLPVMAVVWGCVVLVPAVGIARLVTGQIQGLLLAFPPPLLWAVPVVGILFYRRALAPARHPEADRRDVPHPGRERDIPESGRRAVRRELDIDLIAA
jgi:hypothetical protein